MAAGSLGRSHGAVAAALMTAFVASACASENPSQWGRSWRRLAFCDKTGPRPISGLDVDVNQIASMATQATRVRICTANSTDDCVTSAENSNPIIVLRGGNLLVSHLNGGVDACNNDCVRNIWTGSDQRLAQLTMQNCGGTDEQTPANGHSFLYWACGFGNHLHFEAGGGGHLYCTWGDGNSALELFINAVDPRTTAPTAAPSRAPTAWFESVEHRAESLDTVQRVAVLERQIADSASQINEIGTALSQTTSSLEALRSELSVDISGITTRIDDQSTSSLSAMVDIRNELSQLKVALSASANLGSTNPTCTGNQCEVSIAADGLDLRVNAAGGRALLTTGHCNSADLCDVARFTDNLRLALQSLS